MKPFAVVALMLLSSVLFAETPPLPIGDWTGGLDSGSQWLPIRLHFRPDGADIDVPAFSVEHQALREVRVEGDRVHFEWPRPVGTAAFDGRIDSESMRGDYVRGDVRSTFLLVRTVVMPAATADGYVGSYEMEPGRFLRVATFGGDPPEVTFVDSGTRRVGVLHAVAKDEFVAGPTWEIPLPVDLRLKFVPGGVRWRYGASPVRLAKRVRPHVRHALAFARDGAELQASLLVPAGPGPHPAIALIRPGYTFIPRHGNIVTFFLEQGFAVVALTGKTVAGKAVSYDDASFDERARDVIAAIEAVKARREIDARRIGVWASSLSSWVAPLAASLSSDISFAILHVPSSLPVTENIVFEIENDLREANAVRGASFTPAEIESAKELRRLLNRTILTNEGWDTLTAEIERARSKPWFGYARVGWISSMTLPPDAAALKKLQQPISYDPIPLLERLRIPLLSINAGLDPNVSIESVPLLVRALAKAQNREAIVTVLPTASHGLLESRTGFNSEAARASRYSLGAYELMEDWLPRLKELGQQQSRTGPLPPSRR